MEKKRAKNGNAKVFLRYTIMAIALLFALHENSKRHDSINIIKNIMEKLNNKTFTFDFLSSEEAIKEIH